METERDCIVCAAPGLKPWEYANHLHACVVIEKFDRKDSPKALAEADQLEAEHRAVHQTNVDPGYKAWVEEQRRRGVQVQQPPEGRVPCLVCNGLKSMYPNCVACEGRGWV